MNKQAKQQETLVLLEVARRERDQSKVQILLSALTLVQNDPMVADVIRNISP